MRLTTIAILLALSTTAAIAESHDPAMMSEGLTMLESSTANLLKKYGLEADVMSLSLGQLAEIAGMVTSSNTDAEIKAGIEAALRR